MLKNIEERRRTYAIAEEDDDIKCPFASCAYGAGLAGAGRCANWGEWDNPECPYFITDTSFDEEQSGI